MSLLSALRGLVGRIFGGASLAITAADVVEDEAPLSSSHLTSATYNGLTETMTITFHNGASYTWNGMPRGTYEGLIGADSPGKYFWANIRGR